MFSSMEQVLAAALELSREERTVLVQELLRSLTDDRELLHAAIARSDEQFRAGRGIPAEMVLGCLNKR